MARFECERDQLVFRFSLWEQLGGLRSGAVANLNEISFVEVVDDPWTILEGMRVGTGFPWVIVLGTMLRRGGNDVVAVYQKLPAVVITLQPGARYQRFIATVPDPASVAATIRAALHQRT
ncbi:hypothetical protein [Candidatus Chloroploca sp. Khr17]|uniref:hypothetical protein n=1 Tax=Candidatus Chloroploca sp. Khr17 TaxID=2496869 RepID=UPI00101DF833|nr:hypothetical protein [Candidatus Chloroploca sp. Khr17]